MKYRPAVLAIALAVTLAGCSNVDKEATGGDEAATVNFFGNPDSSGATNQIIDKCNAANTGTFTINYQLLPTDADRQREQLTRRLSAKDPAVDIMAMDVTWTAEFAASGWAKEFTGDAKTKVETGTLAGPLNTARYDDKLYGAPLNTNTQLLWYRKDLVPAPPKTWDEMITMAEALATQKKPHYIEVQGAKYEGLVVWFNSLVNSAGGSILNEDGDDATVSDATFKAAAIMKRLAKSTAADPSLQNTQEDQARLAFESGKAAFELNYPYVYAASQKAAVTPEVQNNIAWTAWPGTDVGKDAKPTLGGVNLGISAFSDNQKQALAAVECMRNSESQKILATIGSLPPTLEALYDDPAVIAAFPMAADLKNLVANGSTRPQTPVYSSVSLAIQNTLWPPSAINPAEVNAKLEKSINDALESKGLQ